MSDNEQDVCSTKKNNLKFFLIIETKFINKIYFYAFYKYNTYLFRSFLASFTIDVQNIARTDNNILRVGEHFF